MLGCSAGHTVQYGVSRGESDVHRLLMTCSIHVHIVIAVLSQEACSELVLIKTSSVIPPALRQRLQHDISPMFPTHL
jgi:hypothetical protein